MNTPSPCDKCQHLYYSGLDKDDPMYSAECTVNEKMGDINCPSYQNLNGSCCKTCTHQYYDSTLTSRCNFSISNKDQPCPKYSKY